MTELAAQSSISSSILSSNPSSMQSRALVANPADGASTTPGGTPGTDAARFDLSVRGDRDGTNGVGRSTGASPQVGSQMGSQMRSQVQPRGGQEVFRSSISHRIEGVYQRFQQVLAKDDAGLPPDTNPEAYLGDMNRRHAELLSLQMEMNSISFEVEAISKVTDAGVSGTRQVLHTSSGG